jgi:hypothetical protein
LNVHFSLESLIAEVVKAREARQAKVIEHQPPQDTEPRTRQSLTTAARRLEVPADKVSICGSRVRPLSGMPLISTACRGSLASAFSPGSHRGRTIEEIAPSRLGIDARAPDSERGAPEPLGRSLEIPVAVSPTEGPLQSRPLQNRLSLVPASRMAATSLPYPLPLSRIFCGKFCRPRAASLLSRIFCRKFLNNV